MDRDVDGGPGVTTSALALASQWPRAALILEADPFGGDIRAGLGNGEWPPDAGIMEAVVDLRSTGLDAALGRRVHRPAEHAPAVLAGVGCVGQASTLPWSRIGSALARLPGADVVADCGRFAVADGVTPLLRTCDVIVVVTGSSLRAVRAAARIAPLLQEELDVRSGDPRVSVLMELAFGERPLELPDHHRIETAVRSLPLLQQGRRSRPPHPRHPT